MAIKMELLNGGLVTARDGTLLKEGELQQADNCIYKPYDPALHRAPGRTVFGAIAAPKGLAHLTFDASPDILLAYSGAYLHAATYSAATGTFGQMTALGSLSNVGGETMDVIPYANAYFILPSNDRPRRIQYVTPREAIVANCTFVGAVVTTSTAVGFLGAVVGQTVTVTAGTVTLAAGTVILSKTTNNLSITLSNTPSGSGSFTVTLSGTSFILGRQVGLDPVSSAAFKSTQVTVVAGVWNTTLGNGYYYFLYTEMVMPGQIDDPNTGFVESGFTGDIQVASITAFASQAVTIARGTNAVNTAATHWQVYMSDKLTTAIPKPSLATFRRIGSPIPIATTSFTYTESGTTVTVTKTPSASDSPISTGEFAGSAAFTTPSGMYTPHDGTTGYSGGYGTIAYRTWGFSIGSGSVRGIAVKLYARSQPVPGAAGAYAYVRIRRRDGVKTAASDKLVAFPFAWSTQTVGGESDTWGESWSATADFTDTAGVFFEVWLIKGGTATTSWLEVDGIEVTVYLTGTSVNRDGVAFKTVTYSSQVGTTVSDSAALPPPVASTGDTFEGQTVTNDLSAPNAIVYSLPDQPEYFPKPYRLVFLSKKKDSVKFIRRVGLSLVVGMQSSLKRVNYLPTEADAEFQRGRAHEDIASDHGVVGPHAGALFDMPGAQGVVLAYVSYKGMRYTNAVTTDDLCTDINWSTLVDAAHLSTCVLRNYPALYLLVLYYAPVGGDGTNTKALYFSYSPDKVKAGNTLPCTGPVNVKATCAAEAVLSGVPKLLTGNPDGNVYVEDSGTTDNSGVGCVPIWRTRLIPFAGPNRDARVQRIFIRAEGTTGDSTVNLTPTITTTADSTAATLVAGGSGLAKGWYLYHDNADPVFQPGTVITAKSGNNLTLSQAALLTATATSVKATAGALAVTVRGASPHEAVTDLGTKYCPVDITSTVIVSPDDTRNSVEIKGSQVTLPDASTADLNATMRIHHIAYDVFDAGPENPRNAA